LERCYKTEVAEMLEDCYNHYKLQPQTPCHSAPNVDARR
jgi:hypothetical protein